MKQIKNNNRKSPIIIQIIGGVGNQLFQYATARALAYKLNRPLTYDISWFANYPLRSFLLNRFCIPLEYANWKDLLILHKQRTRFRRAIPNAWRIHEIPEGVHYFQEVEIPDDRKKSWLTGYWQSEKYFQCISDIVRTEVRLPNPPIGRNATLLDQIRETEAICIHIRRGDYVTNPVVAAYHGVCSLDYYERAIASIEKRTQRPEFYIFSDDISWAKANLNMRHPTTYVDHNTDDPCEDLRLISACKHFIIANSTFSWWGAWLSEHSEKIVIAPKKWFLTKEKDDRDQVPESWIRM